MKDNAEFRDHYHQLLRTATPEVVTRLVTELHASGDAKDMLRFLEHVTKTLGAEADKKADAGAGLPIFNFVFNNGGVQANAVLEKVQEVIDNVVTTQAQPALPNDPTPVLEVEDVKPRTMTVPMTPVTSADIDNVLGI